MSKIFLAAQTREADELSAKLAQKRVEALAKGRALRLRHHAQEHAQLKEEVGVRHGER